MGFLVRFLPSVLIAVVVFLLTLMTVVLAVFLINRGLQWFFRLFDYEMGDFFGWFMSRLPLKKIKKNDKEKGDID